MAAASILVTASIRTTASSSSSLHLLPSASLPLPLPLPLPPPPPPTPNKARLKHPHHHHHHTPFSFSNNHHRIPFFCKASAIRMAVEVEKLNKEFGLNGVKVESGRDDSPMVVLSNELGSSAEVYLYGACVTSWKSMDGKDLLFVRPDAVFNGTKPISGGIPHCFPQFGPGEMQQHGFARNSTWNLLSTENQAGSPSVTFDLEDNDYSRSMWDYAFKAMYKVSLEAERLRTDLLIKNVDTRPFVFTTALHTYFSASITKVSVTGLKGCKTLNKDPDPKNPVVDVEKRESVTFPGFVDCMYLNAPEELILDNGLGDKISIKNKGWTDAVLWNPHLTMEASYKNFVCVENAKLEKVHLQPGESWEAKQVISAV